jgi:hypothetical protein
MPRTLLASILPLSLSVAVACGGGSEPSAGDVSEADAPGEGASPAVSAPADSVIAWAQEIREGIGPLAGQVGSDPDAARKRAVELYVTRQERIEQAAGPGTGASPDLAESVHEAEARFHELMQLLGESPPPHATDVETAVQALDERLAEVVELAGGAGMGSR